MRAHSALARHSGSAYLRAMIPVEHGEQMDANRQAPPAERKNHVPPRPRRKPRHIRRHLHPRPHSAQSTWVRLGISAAAAGVLILVLLALAIKYAERDWARKNQQAHASRVRRPDPPAQSRPDAENAAAGWRYTPPPGAVAATLQRLSGDALIPNWWLIQSRGHSAREQSYLVLAMLRMAMAAGGESAALKNDVAAAYLQQNRVNTATRQLRMALQIEPGFAPALFNSALCATAQRHPAAASRLLAQYLAQRPNDASAYRLQSMLLTQLGQPEVALDILERFLRNQPPEQPLFLETAVLAARLGQNTKALLYLETSLAGNPIQSVVRTYQSSAFRNIRLSGVGDALAAKLAARARVAFSAPLPVEEILPLRATPDAMVR